MAGKYYAETSEGSIVLDATRLEEATDEASRLDTESETIDVFLVDTDEKVATVDVDR